MTTDAEAIAASFATPAVFGDVFDRHATTLYRYLVRRVGPHDADDLTSEVFRIAFERRAAYDAARPDARPWLYGIATNLVARRNRSSLRRDRAVARLGTDAPDDFAERVTDAAFAESVMPDVRDAVDALPDAECDALVLAAWEGLSYDDIAPGTARAVTRRRISKVTVGTSTSRTIASGRAAARCPTSYRRTVSSRSPSRRRRGRWPRPLRSRSSRRSSRRRRRPRTCAPTRG